MMVNRLNIVRFKKVIINNKSTDMYMFYIWNVLTASKREILKYTSAYNECVSYQYKLHTHEKILVC